MSDKLISPCISICKTDPITGFCYGCARTDEEKLWKMKIPQMNGKNLAIIFNRMEGWQLETFKETYKHKKNEAFQFLKNC